MSRGGTGSGSGTPKEAGARAGALTVAICAVRSALYVTKTLKNGPAAGEGAARARLPRLAATGHSRPKAARPTLPTWSLVPLGKRWTP